MAGARREGWSRGMLLWLVFSSGVAVMGLEMCASRLIAPYFGSTLSVWTSLIGLVLVFLTVGYNLGGALADRFASRTVLGAVVLAAGGLTMALPLAAKPVLESTWGLTPRMGILASSLLGSFALFSLPMVLLGCVCPFAMKLSISDLERTGRTSGHIYAISALGSVVGTFLPALFMIDTWGVRHSTMAFGVLLIFAGLLLIGKLRALPAGAPVLLLLAPLPPILPARGAIAQRESPYNYLQVVGVGDARLLIVDWGAFSVYAPGQFRTGEYYDYLLLAPLLRPVPAKEWLHDVLIIGLGSGTASKQITQVYGPLSMDGVEIDPAIVALGREHFAMNEPNLRVHVTDGRAFLGTSDKQYDWVIVDAYQGSDIPFHLVTKEFFGQVRDHLRPGGVLSINIAWWTPDDPELLERIASTVRTAFPSVYAVTGISDQSGAVLLAGCADSSPVNLVASARALGHPDILQIARDVSGDGAARLTPLPGAGEPLTDDRAQVARIADRCYRHLREEAYARERQAVSLRP